MNYQKTVIISLGGSLINPGQVDFSYLKKFKRLILKNVAQGYRFVIVTGGGSVCRRYNEAAERILGKNKVKTIDLDLMGIRATAVNAELVRIMFGDIAYEQIVVNPTKKIKTDQPIIIGCGWRPGCSTDLDAVLMAKNLKASMVINISNTPYIYDRDPKKFPDAKPYSNLTWEEVFQIVGDRWHPGMHTPFDPQAAKLASKLGLKVAVAHGGDLKNLQNILLDKKFKGTMIEN